MGIGFREILIILVIALVVFGSRRLPSIMKDLAKGIQSFKEGMKGEDEAKSINHDDDKPSGDTSGKV